MTFTTPAEYALPIDIDPGCILGGPHVDPSDITVVIPVKDDRDGLLRTLRSLLRLRVRPRHIRVVDDGSQPPIRLPLANCGSTTVSLVRLPSNRGPAAARNAGVADLKGWIYLTDCRCEHDPDLFEHFARSRAEAPDHVVAIASPIIGDGGGRIGRYMTEQGNLNPPMLDHVPQAIITASVLVHSMAGEYVGWFDPRFHEAGGEDIDFGLRLRQVGQLWWCREAVVQHQFEDSVDEFDHRFRRYGRGMGILAEKWCVPMEPFEFQARSTELQALADRQFVRMLEGYRPFRTSVRQ